MSDKHTGKDHDNRLCTRGRLEVKSRFPGKLTTSKGVIIKLDGKEITNEVFSFKLEVKAGDVVRAEIGFLIKDAEVDVDAITYLMDLPPYEEKMREINNGKTPKDFR